MQMDMWSVGCIIAELRTGRPLFPGSDHMDHLNKMCALLGKPDADCLASISSPWAAAYVDSLPDTPPVDLAAQFPEMSPEMVDLLGHLLTWDPAPRYTAKQAIMHPFFAGVHDLTDEVPPSLLPPFPPPIPPA